MRSRTCGPSTQRSSPPPRTSSFPRARTSSSVPSFPSAINSDTVAIVGQYRLTRARLSFVFDVSHAATTASACVTDCTNGFSIKIPRTPASAAAIAISACCWMFREQIATISGLISASICRQSRNPRVAWVSRWRFIASATPVLMSSATATVRRPDTPMKSSSILCPHPPLELVPMTAARSTSFIRIFQL